MLSKLEIGIEVNTLLKKILCPLVLCIGFINSAQAGLIETHNLSDVNSSVKSDSVQSWFGINVTDEFSFFILSVDWRDQGWGNQKGRIYFRMSGFDWLSSGLLAQHNWVNDSIEVTRKELMSLNPVPHSAMTLPTTLEVGYVVGGGGGHRLKLRNAALTVTNIPKLSPAIIDVPEPSSLALLILAALGFTTAKRRSK